MGKLVPLILMLLGGAVGGGAGMMFKPAEPECAADDKHCEADAEAKADKTKTSAKAEDEPHYITMKNQFVVPVIQDSLVRSLVVMTLTLETTPDDSPTIFSREPKIRDVLLRVLFDHAHMGGFNGAFTESGRMASLRVALLEAVQSIVAEKVSDVLITDIVRQEM